MLFFSMLPVTKRVVMLEDVKKKEKGDFVKREKCVKDKAFVDLKDFMMMIAFA